MTSRAFSLTSIARHPQLECHSTSCLQSSAGANADEDTLSSSSSSSSSSSKASSFSDLGLNPQVLSAVHSFPDWRHPTPVQTLAIPQLLQMPNPSVWCEAPTGSGKTAAYTLPLLQNILLQGKNQQKQQQSQRGRISSLILCPTRELAVQIGHVVSTLANNLSLSSKRHKPNVMTLYGGIPLQPQIDALSDANRYGHTIDVLVATPGRLVDVLTYYTNGGDSSAKDAVLERKLLQALDDNGGNQDATLSLEQLERLELDTIEKDATSLKSLLNLLEGLDYLVLDEADRLLGRAFESELDAVLELLPKAIPTWMFSATFPKAIEPRLDGFLTRVGASNPVKLQCAAISAAGQDGAEDDDVSVSLQKKLQHTKTTSKASTLQQVAGPSTIQLRAIRLHKPDRTQALKQLLLEEHPEWDRVLVFCSTRYGTEHVARKLRRANIKAGELHGKLDQDARMRRLQDLKRGKIRVLLTTDVSSRGIDIAGLPAVVNYDLPRSTADFVHRVGRTGRAGKPGTAVTFVTAEANVQLELIEERHLAQPIKRETLQGIKVNEEKWNIQAEASKMSIAAPSSKGLAHDKMFGGIKGRRKSKKDRLREQQAAKEQRNK